MKPYAPRSRDFLGLLDAAGYRLKHYTIGFDGGHPDAGWAGGLADLLADLPTPAITPERPGLGLLIQHRGAGVDYQVLAWWDQENELPLRLRIRDHGSKRWREPRRNESVCVWDLEVIGFERDRYVEFVLASAADLSGYLHAACADRR